METAYPGGMTTGTPGFQTLLPDQIIDCVESTGLACDGDLLALNSYENRVYRVGTGGEQRIVVKFYRPSRWSDEAIREEHAFAYALEGLDVPIVTPLVFDGQSLIIRDAFRFAIYPFRPGRWPQLEDEQTLRQLGRLTARMHLAGEQETFRHRPEIEPISYGYDSRDYLLDNEVIPEDLEDAYATLADDLLESIDDCFDRTDFARRIRIHGDLHPGNILQDQETLYIVDTDDARTGPAIQDLWMFLSGEPHEQRLQMEVLLEGYRTFRTFDEQELALIEPLRTLRIMHYAAWLARRWEDPAFKAAFPWFDSVRYWSEHILTLREQLAAMREPAFLAYR
ncbi:MAG: serine/threonine protein kinase [Pseudomonadota bacterium]